VKDVNPQGQDAALVVDRRFDLDDLVTSMSG